MGDVAKEGRTVLFVSHNMAAIQNLCPRSILIVNGRIHSDSSTQAVIKEYLGSIQDQTKIDLAMREDRRGEGGIRFTGVELLNEEMRPMENAITGDKLRIRLHYKRTTEGVFRKCRLGVSVNALGNPFFLASNDLVRNDELIINRDSHIDCVINNLPLSKGDYYLNLFMESNGMIQDWVQGAKELTVVDGDFYGTGRNYPPGWEGRTVLVKHRWEW